MFPEVGATELMVIAAVALIVVGPKDLPVLLRKLGQFMAKMRGMANEFRASFDEMARQSELDELRREVQALRDGRYADPISAAANAHTAEINDTFYGIQSDLTSQPAQFSPPDLTPDPAYDSLTPLPAEDDATTPAKAKRVRKPKAAVPAETAAPAKPRARRPKAGPEADA